MSQFILEKENFFGDSIIWVNISNTFILWYTPLLIKPLATLANLAKAYSECTSKICKSCVIIISGVSVSKFFIFISFICGVKLEMMYAVYWNIFQKFIKKAIIEIALQIMLLYFQNVFQRCFRPLVVAINLRKINITDNFGGSTLWMMFVVMAFKI